MRTLLPLLVLLLTASAAWAGVRVPGREGDLSRAEELQLYGKHCAICMGIVFAPVLVFLLGGLVRHWLIRRGTKPPKRERKFQPPGD